MIIQLPIENKRITDLLHGHGGSMSPWLHEVNGEWHGAGDCCVRFDREEDEEGDGKGHKTVKEDQVKFGLALMAQNSPHQFGQFLNGNDDDVTFDTAWQYIIFGKLVYA